MSWTSSSENEKKDTYNPSSTWKTAEQILLSFADALAEWLGGSIIVTAYTLRYQDCSSHYAD